MKLLSYQHAGRETWGVVIGDGVFFNDTATTEIYTSSFVGSVRCV